ncbi:hypothetical protein BJX64DRAFT_281173 [Aspergillus heterothallicus]
MQLCSSFGDFLSSLRKLRDPLQQDAQSEPLENEHLSSRLENVFLKTWHLGLTSFGDLAVHFQTLHLKFVKHKNALLIVLLHLGFLPAVLALVLWRYVSFLVFRVRLTMYALSLGVQSLDKNLPDPVYALISGLNASIAGIVALSAVQLAEKLIQDKLARLLVIFNRCSGLCYSVIWYFPVLMASGGLLLHKVKSRWRLRNVHLGDAQVDSPTAEKKLASWRRKPAPEPLCSK